MADTEPSSAAGLESHAPNGAPPSKVEPTLDLKSNVIARAEDPKINPTGQILNGRQEHCELIVECKNSSDSRPQTSNVNYYRSKSLMRYQNSHLQQHYKDSEHRFNPSMAR
jgi:hypothetical protein